MQVTTTILDDTATTVYRVLVDGRVAWERFARKGTRQQYLDALANAQAREAKSLMVKLIAEGKRENAP